MATLNEHVAVFMAGLPWLRISIALAGIRTDAAVRRRGQGGLSLQVPELHRVA